MEFFFLLLFCFVFERIVNSIWLQWNIVIVSRSPCSRFSSSATASSSSSLDPVQHKVVAQNKCAYFTCLTRFNAT